MDSSINENQQNETENRDTELTEQHYVAVTMRLNGYGYNEIACRVKRKAQTVRSWFSNGGTCTTLYEKERHEAKIEHSKHLENLKEEMDGIVSCAVNVVKKALPKKVIHKSH